ncbi:MAG: hypothetical protein N2560_08915 [Ignavibacteria bacterium]|nr:hypothetical protein [Ignavibacteria bacterium]
MKRFFLFLLGIILWNQSAFAQKDTIERILISQVEFGKNVEGLNYLKVEAAMNLVARFSKRFEIIPFDFRDSVAKMLEKNGIEPTHYNIGKQLGASRILALRINRLANIIRTDIFSFNLSDSTFSKGKGYALIRYFKKEKNEPILDPSLLTALQRAFAELINEPLLYSNLEGSLKVKPAPTLVIGAINYIENDTISNWEIFQKKQTTSYFAIETIFEIAMKSTDFVVFDIPTRDTIYAYFNLFEPENFNPPNINEIQALQQFEVDYYIAGEFYWDSGNARLKLILCKITEEGLEIMKEETKIVPEDNIESFKNTLIQLTKDLLNISG